MITGLKGDINCIYFLEATLFHKNPMPRVKQTEEGHKNVTQKTELR
jgi:hypothetical protein